MTRTIVEVPLFSKRWEEIGLGDHMESLFEDLCVGLQQAIDYEELYCRG